MRLARRGRVYCILSFSCERGVYSWKVVMGDRMYVEADVGKVKDGCREAFRGTRCRGVCFPLFLRALRLALVRVTRPVPLPPPPLLLGIPPRASPLLLVPRAQALAAEHEVVVVDGDGLDELVGLGGGVVEVVLGVWVWGGHLCILRLGRG